LLDVARIESGRLELLLQAVDLKTLLTEVTAEQMPQLEARSQQIRLTVADGVPLALIDPHRTAQVVGNLVSNASKYAPVGTVVTLDLAEAADEPGFLCVAVTDQGAGIPLDEQDLLFRPFFRGASALHTAPGTGLGLYIAKSLVELHGGRVTLESRPGAGTTFYATFPVALGAPRQS
jgi:two-component system capsular synthesis sensor histidine kinase RcsC